MGIENLDKVFHPESVAVIGANPRPSGIGSAILENLLDSGFNGPIHPVNPAHAYVRGLATVKSVLDLTPAPDLAIIATPIETVPEIVAQCAQADVAGAMIPAAGGRETGKAGRAVENRIRAAAEGTGLRLIGPNAMGIISGAVGLNASLAPRMPLAGKTAFISQSGAIFTSILDLSIRERVGFSHFVGLGSAIDVDFGDIIDYLGGEPHVNSIVLYIEQLDRVRHFMSAARAISRVKPIIAFKAGRSRIGKAADAVHDAAFDRAGILRVRTFEELLDCAELLAKQPRPTAPGLAIITNAGGPGLLAADALADVGTAPAELRPETLARLDAILPPYWTRTNPVDLLATATPELYRNAVEICLAAPEVDGVLVILAPHSLSRPADSAAAIANGVKGARKPVLTAWIGGASVDGGRGIFNEAGIPTFDTPERAVRAFMDLHRYAGALEALQMIPRKLPDLTVDRKGAGDAVQAGLKVPSLTLATSETAAILAAYGLPVPRNRYTEESQASPTEADTPAVHDADYELMVGAGRYPGFGPVIRFGMGGRMTAVISDIAIALPPLNRLLARRLISKTRVGAALSSHNGHPAANLEALEIILVRLSLLVADFPEIAEIEINPLRVRGDRIVAGAARIRLQLNHADGTSHLVISPYPNQYEDRATLKDDTELLIRPIRPEDAPLFLDLFNALSPQSVYFRFFSAMRSIRPDMLARFTQIDYDREMALVALHPLPDAEPRMLGVARVIVERNGRDAEFSVLVRDAWQGRGVGAELLRRCLDVARQWRLAKVWGIVLPDNRNMIALGRKLGFDVKRDPESGDYMLTIRLGKAEGA